MSGNTKGGVTDLSLLASAWRVTAMGLSRLIKVIYHPHCQKKGSLPGAKKTKGKYLNYILKVLFICLLIYSFTYLCINSGRPWGLRLLTEL